MCDLQSARSRTRSWDIAADKTSKPSKLVNMVFSGRCSIASTEDRIERPVYGGVGRF